MQFTDLLYLYVNKKTITGESVDEALVKLAVEQSLQTILYPVTNDNQFKKYYISWVIKQEQFYSVQKDISLILNKECIPHFFFKGSVISGLYDDKSVRTRGDIDFYVSPENFEKAKVSLLSNGFVLSQEKEDCMHHQALKKDGIECEMHFSLFDKDMDKTWLEMFKNPFIHSRVKDKYLYEMDDTYHLIYCILHFAHHLRHGAGIRYCLDFYYMFKKMDIDMEYLHESMKILKTERLYSNIINSLRYIFKEEFDSDIPKADVSFFIDYMLSYGIHGHSNNETSIQASVHKSKFKYAISRIFLTDKNYRLSRFLKLGKHWYFYPICLIYHWFYLLTHKLGSFFKFLFGRNKNKRLYKKLGI